MARAWEADSQVPGKLRLHASTCQWKSPVSRGWAGKFPIGQSIVNELSWIKSEPACWRRGADSTPAPGDGTVTRRIPEKSRKHKKPLQLQRLRAKRPPPRNGPERGAKTRPCLGGDREPSARGWAGTFRSQIVRSCWASRGHVVLAGVGVDLLVSRQWAAGPQPMARAEPGSAAAFRSLQGAARWSRCSLRRISAAAAA